jgi:hypothetical protein
MKNMFLCPFCRNSIFKSYLRDQARFLSPHHYCPHCGKELHIPSWCYLPDLILPLTAGLVEGVLKPDAWVVIVCLVSAATLSYVGFLLLASLANRKRKDSECG